MALKMVGPYFSPRSIKVVKRPPVSPPCRAVACKQKKCISLWISDGGGRDFIRLLLRTPEEELLLKTLEFMLSCWLTWLPFLWPITDHDHYYYILYYVVVKEKHEWLTWLHHQHYEKRKKWANTPICLGLQILNLSTSKKLDLCAAMKMPPQQLESNMLGPSLMRRGQKKVERGR